MTTANTEVHAMFESAKYTITYSGKYTNDGAVWNDISATQGTFTVKNGNNDVTSGASLSYNTTLTLTATPGSGYAVEGVYWSTDNGTTWTKVECTVSNGVYSNNTFKVINNYLLEARFIKVYKLSAFDSYEMNNSQVTFVTAPPKSIQIKHTDAHGTATTYTYSYDGTKTAGNPDSPDGSKPAALAIASGTYGQGNYIQYYAGDEITLTYSAMASSEILKGVFYDNTKSFYVNKPDSDHFVAHSHPTTPAIYMNSTYYNTTQLDSRDFSGVTADNDAHSVKFTGTQDYKNIDVEIGTKRKVYFSDYTNTVINSKNTDDYYYDREDLSVAGDQLTVKAKQSATQTNKIVASGIKFYRATESGGRGTELTTTEILDFELSVSGSESTSSSSADGAEIVINGKMPTFDLYIDLNMQNSYTLKLGTKVVCSLGEANVIYLKQKANTISIAGTTTLNANTSGYVTTDTTSVNTGTTATLTVSGITSGYSSPLRIYLDADTKDLDVVATAIYSDLYVSNGYDVGSTVKTDAVTVEPVVDGVVKTSGQTGYFNVNASTTYIEDPDNTKCHEGTVTKYSPSKKGATVRITKKAGGNDKIVAFLVYDIDNKTVRAEKNITKGTTADSKTPYYFDLTLANEKQNLYIVPIVEEAGAKVTITFDATQLNRAQWGDIVTAYTWYKNGDAPGLGAYPGQPMIPSDDMSTWTTTFTATKGGNELAGITFSNYVDGAHSWLGRSGVMGSEVNSGTQNISTSGGIITQYNIMKDTDWDSKNKVYKGTYNKANFKAQTYDYHEPLALYNRYSASDENVSITFQMKDGNSSLISWKHTEFDDNNILNLPAGWGKLNWEYLTNAKGDKYIDMNGNPMNTKPTASFYVASKGQVIYNNSTMNYVFHGGHNYQMKGYDATYSDPASGQSRGSYTRTALAAGQWSSDITYGGATALNMKYAVQWYVYDAQGNYITTVLFAGIADLSSNNIDTYIGKVLEDQGYAVDGKSVAICYDKPRYMYGDWDSVTYSASNINSGPYFDAYRFEGQWIAAGQTDTVKVNVEVAMMTDSGEELAHSNTAGYGNATAALRSGINFGKSNYATAATDGSWAQTAASDAKLNGIVLNASAQNFIGWYYYDANTGDFTKATYSSNENFYPNYTNKDVTYYAVYRASAVYNYIYEGREGERTYSATGNDLTPEEMAVGDNQNKVFYDNHSADVLAKLPVGIGVFKKNIDFSAANADSWTKNNDKQYILKLSGFEVTLPTYTLTAHYKGANNEEKTITKTEVYNGTAVDLTVLNKGSEVTTEYSKKFLGWYAYDHGVRGDLLSTQQNYGLRLTRDQAIIAVYDENGSTTRDEDSEGWKIFIDENEVNKELTTSSSGVFYNDTIVRVRKGSDAKATLPTNAKIGVLVISDNKIENANLTNYTDTQLKTLVTSIANGKTMKAKSGISITNMQASAQTNFNRTDIAVRSDFAKNNGTRYSVYAYFYDGDNYTFSEVSGVKTYE